MATFQEVFDEMLKRVEEDSVKLKEKDLIIEKLEAYIADLENQLNRLRKTAKKAQF